MSNKGFILVKGSHGNVCIQFLKSIKKASSLQGHKKTQRIKNPKTKIDPSPSPKDEN